LILALFGAIVGLGTAISGPARTWAAKLPEGIPRLEERLSFIRAPINTLQLFLQQVENIGETGPSPNGAISERGATFLLNLFTGTRNFASGFFTTVLFLFFLLVSGDIFLLRLVENSRALGASARSWKSRCLIFLLAGMLTHDTLWQALLPAGLYFGFHLIEGETLTPMLLARRFTLNPVLVIISLVFWFWIWGIPGGILSMPMLAITKIICDRLQPLAAFGHFLEG
jgi:predicted PurR-regulated permease PerM